MTTQLETGTERDGSVVLVDGRTLTYAELGDPAGGPVVVLDGPGSRGLARAAHDAAVIAGARLIVPDRPGFGGSTPDPGRTYRSWPPDLAGLLDALGIGSFGIFAQSGGTPFAFASAVALPDRVRALAFTGAVSPLGERGALDGVAGPMRMNFVLARRAPWLLRPLLGMASRQMRKDPEKAAGRFVPNLPPADREVLAAHGMQEMHVRTTAEILGSTKEMAHEIRMLARPWEVDLGAVRPPVAFWVGEQDGTHPPEMSRRLAARLGNAPVKVVPAAGTFGLRPLYGDVLAFALRD